MEVTQNEQWDNGTKGSYAPGKKTSDAGEILRDIPLHISR